MHYYSIDLFSFCQEWLENEGQRLHKCHHTEHAVGPHLYTSVGNWCISDITRKLSPKLIVVT
jgi:hypothetical protein